MTTTNNIDDSSAAGETPAGFATAFNIYHQRGWAVMPIPPDAKGPPPTGFTGRGGASPSYADMLDWAQDPRHADGNVAIRLPPNGCGIDVDNYDSKEGAATLTHAESLWGTVPPTFYSTSRDDGSRIMLYRIPVGVELQSVIEFRDLGLSGLEICQFHHRYVMCWPSINPKTKRIYRWYAPDGDELDGPPAYEELPELPREWIDALRVDAAHSGAELLPVSDVELENCLTDGQMSGRVTRKLGEALTEVFGTGRHDHIRNRVLSLLRLGKNGEPGVKRALLALREAFGNVAENTNRDGGRKGARNEFHRFIYKYDANAGKWVPNDRVRQLLSDRDYDYTDTTDNADADASSTTTEYAPGEHTYTDSGNGTNLVAKHHKRLQYVSATGKWLRWDGAAWHKESDSGTAEYKARTLAAEQPIPEVPAELIEAVEAANEAAKEH